MSYPAALFVVAIVLVVPVYAQTPDWVQMTPANSPSDRARSAMAYDSVMQKVVLFGGRGSSSFNDTWKYDGVDWAQVTPANSPGVRSLHVMAYDSVRQKMVVFGGAGPAPLHDTWEYDGVDWMQVTPTGNVFPSNRHSHAMVYDSARQMMVMFGGYGSSIFNDTWEYDGVGWTQITTANSPSPRMGHTMVYDSARGRVVLFGGQNSSSSWNNDTWEYDGSNWTQVVTASSPMARPRHAMAYDSTLQKVVMFGGYGVGNIHLNDTWEYDGVTWAQMATASSPDVRYYHEMVYDSARGQMVMFGGADAAPVGGGGPPTGPWEIYLGDTWEYGSQDPANISIPASSPTGCNGALVHYTSAVTPPNAGSTASWASGTTAVLTVSNLDPAFNLGILVFGNQPSNAPLFGGLLIPWPDVVSIVGGSGGVASLSITIPPGLGGNTFWTQFAGFDSCVAAGELTFSNGQSHLLP